MRDPVNQAARISIPAILFFKDGKLVDQVIGFVGKPALAEKFKQHAA